MGTRAPSRAHSTPPLTDVHGNGTLVATMQLQKDADRAKARYDVELCDYMLRLNDSEMRRRVDVMNSLSELYSAQTAFYEENLATMSSLAGYMKDLVAQTAQVSLALSRQSGGAAGS